MQTSHRRTTMNAWVNGTTDNDRLSETSPASDSSELFRFAMAVRDKSLLLPDNDRSRLPPPPPTNHSQAIAQQALICPSDNSTLRIQYNQVASVSVPQTLARVNDIPWYEQTDFQLEASDEKFQQQHQLRRYWHQQQQQPQQQQNLQQQQLQQLQHQQQQQQLQLQQQVQQQYQKQQRQQQQQEQHQQEQQQQRIRDVDGISTKITQMNDAGGYNSVQTNKFENVKVGQYCNVNGATTKPPMSTSHGAPLKVVPEHERLWNIYVENKKQKSLTCDPAYDSYTALCRNECSRLIKVVPTKIIPLRVNELSNQHQQLPVRNNLDSKRQSPLQNGFANNSHGETPVNGVLTYQRHVGNPTNQSYAMGHNSPSAMLQHNEQFKLLHLKELHNGAGLHNSITSSNRSSFASVLETDLDTGEERDVVVMTEPNGEINFLPIQLPSHNADKQLLSPNVNEQCLLNHSATSSSSNSIPLSSAALHHDAKLNHNSPRSKALASKFQKSPNIRIKPLNDIVDALQEVERVATSLHCDDERPNDNNHIADSSLPHLLSTVYHPDQPQDSEKFFTPVAVSVSDDNLYQADSEDNNCASEVAKLCLNGSQMLPDKNALSLNGLSYGLQCLSEHSTLSRRSRQSSLSGASTPTESVRDRVLRLLEDVTAEDDQSIAESIGNSSNDPFKVLVDDPVDKSQEELDAFTEAITNFDSDPAGQDNENEQAMFDDTKIIVKCKNPKCDSPSLSLAEARTTFKSCHNCYVYYCSRECRKAHWERHKRRCVFSRLKSTAKRIMRKIYEDGAAVLEELSRIARMGYIRYGRGCVLLLFTSNENAAGFIINPNCSLSNFEEPPIYVSCKQLADYRVFVDQKSELDKAIKSYNPEIKFVFEIVILTSEADKSLSSSMTSSATSVNQPRRLAIKKCAKLRLIQQMCGKVQTGEDDADTLILTALPNPEYAENMAGQKARQLCFINIQQQLRKRGVSLRRQYPEVYSKLCAYVADEQTFVPIALMPRNGNTGKRFMCLIMPDSEPDSTWIDRSDLLESIGITDSAF